jgi:anti-sigma B factor antagonist
VFLAVDQGGLACARDGNGAVRVTSEGTVGGEDDNEISSGSGPERLQITISFRDGRCHTVVSGELDISTAPLLRDRLAEITDGFQSDLSLDIGLLTFIDSTGLSLLVAQHKRLLAQGGALIIYSPTASARRLFDISGLSSLFTVVPASVGR